MVFTAVLALGAANGFAEESAQAEGQQQKQIKPAVTAHPRFMKEYSVWTYNILAKEDDIRATVVEFLKEKAAESEDGKLSVEDINTSSMELIVHIEEKLGVRMGAFKTKLAGWAKLDKKETQVYGSGLRLMSGYLSAIELQEAKTLDVLDGELGENAPDPVKFKRRLAVGLAPFRAIELTDEQKKQAPSFIGAIMALDKAAKAALENPEATSGDE
jgi:acyl carrier protein